MEKRLKMRGYSGTKSPKESERERLGRSLARRAAAEGMVLLANDGVLPLHKGQKAALYGAGARHTIAGGTGSGAVNCREIVSIDQGLRNAGIIVTTDHWLDDYDREYEEAKNRWTEEIYEMAGPPGDFERLYRAHASHPMPAPKGTPVSMQSRDEGDVALFVISRVSGEGADRWEKQGDYYLSKDELNMLASIQVAYPKTVVILNVGGIMDLSFLDMMHVSGVVLMSQAGMEGGNALADVLTGAVNPCGKLTDTWARSYGDYPGSADYSHNNGNVIEEFYKEGIYVGYRYFDSFGIKPRYPFGYGLSYTHFSWRCDSVRLNGQRVEMDICVTNTGGVPGREVVQVYVSCPDGKLVKEQKRLAAFKKTALLKSGKSEILKVSFSLDLLESYHSGRRVWLLEKGEYGVYLGSSSEELVMAARLVLDEDAVTARTQAVCPLLDALTEMEPEHKKEPETLKKGGKGNVAVLKIGRENIPFREIHYTPRFEEESSFSGIREAEERPWMPSCKEEPGKASVLTEENVSKEESRRACTKKSAELAAQTAALLTVEEMAALVCGEPGGKGREIIGDAAAAVPGAAAETTSALLKSHNVGVLVLADGPAGIRVSSRYEVNPGDGSIYQLTRYENLENRIFKKEFHHEGAEVYYQYATAIPVGTLLAQTFDEELLEEVGRMIGAELEEFGISLWLAPGMNIHRNPLCGRNFEYYSEDPFLSGKMAAAITRGVQSHPGVGAVIKHFACNNQEENRRGVSSIVSERALREIYLKGFEIAVREAHPVGIMTSYNKVNGVHTANSYDLCTKTARDEWGFGGVIMTDWTTTNMGGGSSAAKCIEAGNDLIMPGNPSDIREITEAVRGEGKQYLDERYLRRCAENVLRVIFDSNAYETGEDR